MSNLREQRRKILEEYAIASGAEGYVDGSHLDQVLSDLEKLEMSEVEIIKILKSKEELLKHPSNVKSIKYFRKLHTAEYRKGRFKGHYSVIGEGEEITKEDYEKNVVDGEKKNTDAFMDRLKCSYYTYYQKYEYIENDIDVLIAKALTQQKED